MLSLDFIVLIRLLFCQENPKREATSLQPPIAITSMFYKILEGFRGVKISGQEEQVQ